MSAIPPPPWYSLFLPFAQASDTFWINGILGAFNQALVALKITPLPPPMFTAVAFLNTLAGLGGGIGILPGSLFGLDFTGALARRPIGPGQFAVQAPGGLSVGPGGNLLVGPAGIYPSA